MAYPQFAGVDGRLRIKQWFQPATAMLPLWYPPKWGINDDLLLARNHFGNSFNTRAEQCANSCLNSRQ